MQLVSHTWYSKCPPLALMHALNRFVKLRMDLSMGSCGKSFQIDWRATFNSEIFVKCGWYFWQRSHLRCGNLRGLSPVNLGAIRPYWWTLDNWRQSTSASIVRCVRGHRLVERWSHLEAVCYSLRQDFEANSQRSIWHSLSLFRRWSAAYHEIITGYNHQNTNRR